MENKNKNNNGEVEEEECSIDGDILASILSTLPLLDLDSACHVSKSWNRAVFFSLNRLKSTPWLLLYKQRSHPPYTMAATATAYDPKSEKWIELSTGSSPVEHAARSSHSTLLYALSPARLSFSVDAFHLMWQHAPPPRVWRIDPIVAVVGRRLIVAGGACEFEDDRLAVESLDIGSFESWERCESMPQCLSGSASSTWLSVAVSAETMYVTEKRSGVSFCFDPETKSWAELPDFSPDDCRLYSRAIGFVSNRLVMAGITGDEDDPKGIELWEVVSTESRMKLRFESVGSMPEECLEKLRGIDSDWPLTSIVFNAVGDMVYMHNNAGETGEIVAAEMEGGKLCKWRTLRNADARGHAGERLVVACSNVSFSDLKRAFRDGLSFSVVAV
ncbi:F-box/kelch-repeat protein [Hirschfeldia incana]|nr:F-box/kelch-repeat protein [Hirschfeldia incana]